MTDIATTLALHNLRVEVQRLREATEEALWAIACEAGTLERAKEIFAEFRHKMAGED
jgi:hypothetical protein